MFRDYVDFHDALSCYEHLAALKKDNPDDLHKLKSNFLMYAKLRVEMRNDPDAQNWVKGLETLEEPEPIMDERPAPIIVLPDPNKKDSHLYMSTINSMIGLKNTKKQIEELVNYIRINDLRQKVGLTSEPLSMHMTFLGNPGTGKTSVARNIAGVLYSLGIVRNSKFIEVDRSDLIGKKIGQTEDKVREVFFSAYGGVLFIDEAHALLQPYCDLDYGHECVATLVKLMEDERNNVVVIFAGYKQEMEQTLLAHKGIKSRINHHINFADFTPKENLQIFQKFCDDNNFMPTQNSLEKLSAYLEGHNPDRLGYNLNARDIRNIFEKTVICHAQRLMSVENPGKKALKELLPEDIVLPVNAKKNKIIYLKN